MMLKSKKVVILCTMFAQLTGHRAVSAVDAAHLSDSWNSGEDTAHLHDSWTRAVEWTCACTAGVYNISVVKGLHCVGYGIVSTDAV